MAKSKQITIPPGVEAFFTTNEGYRVTATFVAGKRNKTYYTAISPRGVTVSSGWFYSGLDELSWGDLDNAYELTMKDIAHDSQLEENRFVMNTAGDHEIKEFATNHGTIHVMAYRPDCGWVVGHDYDTKKGCWAGGQYFRNRMDAENYMNEEYPNRKKLFSRNIKRFRR